MQSVTGSLHVPLHMSPGHDHMAQAQTTAYTTPHSLECQQSCNPWSNPCRTAQHDTAQSIFQIWLAVQRAPLTYLLTAGSQQATTAQHTAQNNTAQHGTAWHSAAQHSTRQLADVSVAWFSTNAAWCHETTNLSLCKRLLGFSSKLSNVLLLSCKLYLLGSTCHISCIGPLKFILPLLC